MSSPSPAAETPPSIRTLPEGFLNALDDSVEEPVPWIISDLLAEGEQMLVYGDPKVGKSQFALQLAMSVALGKPFLGREIPRRRRVLYLNFEMGRRPFMLRVARHYVVATSAGPEAGNGIGPEKEESSRPVAYYPPPDQKLREEINREIEGRLIFSDELRGLGIGGFHVGLSTEEEAAAKAADRLAKRWQATIDAIKPELIIFDTLSKTHSINDSDNNAIKGVLSLLRRIATVGESPGDATERSEEPKRREIAHVVVHHARKRNPQDSSSDMLSPDSIRGASAIRAEADLILGLSGRSHPTNDKPEVGRWMSTEARNLPADDCALWFDGWTFRVNETPKTQKAKLSDEDLAEKIKNVFLTKGVRGISSGILRDALWPHGKNGFDNTAAVRIAAYAAKKTGAEIQRLEKAPNQSLIASFPVESKRGGDFLYWIRDGSPWLEEESLKVRFEKHRASMAAQTEEPKPETTKAGRKNKRARKGIKPSASPPATTTTPPL